jgi:hypothetical protein
MTTSANSTYEISQESAENVSEDKGNVTKGLSEAPNQSSEDNNTNIPDFSPTSKGKPRTQPTILFTLQSISVTVHVFVMLGIYFVSVKYVFVCIKFMSVYVKFLKI